MTYNKVYFLVLPNMTLGSTQLRAIQVGNELKNYNYDYEIIPFSGPANKNLETLVSTFQLTPEYIAKINSIQNQIVIILKNLFLPAEQVKVLHDHNNIVILDTIDIWYFLESENIHLLEAFPFYDSILVYNNYSKQIAQDRFPEMQRCDVIYHHWDVRLQKQNNDENFSIGFCGQNGKMFSDDTPNCLYLDQFPEIKQKDPNELGYWPCYYTIRSPDCWQSRYKSNIKLSNAAAVGSNIITTPDRCVVDLIDYDYPYLTNHDLDSVRKTVEFAKATYGGPVWKYGLDMMEVVRKNTDLKVIIHDYLSLFDQLKIQKFL